MLDLITPPFVPFSAALAMLAGLLLLELILLTFGASLALEADAPDAAFDVPDLDAAELDALGEGLASPEGFELAEVDTPAPAPPQLGWTGMGAAPFLVWLGTLLAGFGATGLVVQWTGPWPLWLAVPVAGAVGLAGARGFAGVFARAIPALETSAVSHRQLARRRGTVTQGTARRGRPAELRVADRWGNAHWVRAEPLRDADAIARGAEVLTVWDHRAGALRIVALD